MKEIFAAIWRFGTDECQGGRKFTALAMKGCAMVLAGCIYTIWEATPRVYEAWQDYQDSMSSLTESVNSIKHAIELDGVRYSSKDLVQDSNIARLRSDVDEAQRDVAQAGRDIVGLRGDVRRLDEVTVKVGRP